MFEFATAGRIIFGAGVVKEIGPIAAAVGRRALVVTGSDPARAEPVFSALKRAGIACTPFAVRGEPTTDTIQESIVRARAGETDLVIGVGGGSAIDTAKAAAALLTNDGDLFDYLEVIGKALPLRKPPLPCIAVPTTAGAGAEVTRNAVLSSRAHRVKVSLRSPLMLPRAAVVDPELTCSLPPALTAHTGLDALTQVIEPFVSSRANPLTDAICLEGMRRAAGSLRRACEAGHDLQARENMAVASLCGGLALANAGLGAVHGFAAPIGGLFDAPHGAVCAALLPHALEINIRALRRHGSSLERFDTVARAMTGRPQATAEDGIGWIKELCADLHVPPLRRYGVTSAHVDELCEKAAQASSMKANPVALTGAELRELLGRAI